MNFKRMICLKKKKSPEEPVIYLRQGNGEGETQPQTLWTAV